MKSLGNTRLFCLAVLFGILVVLGIGAYDRWVRRPPIVANKLTSDIFVTEQIQLADIPALRARGFASIVDLRPDGEVAEQPSAKDVESITIVNHMGFAYVPVLHGEIPDSAVDALNKALSTNSRPVLLYCRSGRRAVRTWSLVEASRAGGMKADVIQATAKAAGQSVDDLLPAIAERIARRQRK